MILCGQEEGKPNGILRNLDRQEGSPKDEKQRVKEPVTYHLWPLLFDQNGTACSGFLGVQHEGRLSMRSRLQTPHSTTRPDSRNPICSNAENGRGSEGNTIM